MAKSRIGSQNDQPFIKLFHELTYNRSPWEIWQDYIAMFACAISNSVDKLHFEEREKEYLDRIKKYRPEEQNIFAKLGAEMVIALQRNPEQDFLGEIFMKLNLGNEHNGQFFTPYNICQMMASLTLQDPVKIVNEHGYICISDPACGAGATLIAAVHAAKEPLIKAGMRWQDCILVAAQDINDTAALMCYIQLALLGVPGYVKIGNTLSDPMCSQDTLENYWFTPLCFSDIWATRHLITSIFNN